MITSNQPNAAKLLSSLRNTGYDSYTALEDIIDNSIDAGARNIGVSIETADKDIRITISDDGLGMSEKVLDEALKLGSETEKNEISDLGKYGMGLCTASISIAKKLEVITKRDGDNYWYSRQDLDEVVKLNDFKKESHAATKEEMALFKKLVPSGHGTIVVLSKTDRISNSNTTIFAGTLAREIGRIFRKFIAAGISINVNGKKITSNDPLMEDAKGTRIYSDEEYEVPTSAGREKVCVKIAILPKFNDELEEEMQMNTRTQGFYILRNNREIESGVTLDVFKRHNRFNRLRMELYFTSNLDNEMGVRFSKDGVTPNQAIKDYLKKEIGGQVASISKMLEKPKNADKAKEVDHDQSALVISKKAKLLITPDPGPIGRIPRSDKGGNHTKVGEGKSETETRNEQKESRMSVRFETLTMGRNGTLYDCYQEGKIIVIQWNVNHPFYEKLILANRDRKDVTAGIDYLVYGLASAELKTISDDNIGLINTIKSIMSANLSSLLS